MPTLDLGTDPTFMFRPMSDGLFVSSISSMEPALLGFMSARGHCSTRRQPLLGSAIKLGSFFAPRHIARLHTICTVFELARGFPSRIRYWSSSVVATRRHA